MTWLKIVWQYMKSTSCRQDIDGHDIDCIIYRGAREGVSTTLDNLLSINGPYIDVIMSVTASQIISVSIAYSTVCSGAAQRKHQSSASLASKGGIHRWPVDSSHKGPVTRKMFSFDDVIMVEKYKIYFMFPQQNQTINAHKHTNSHVEQGM